MIKRTIEISSGPTRLYIRNRNLVIDREGREPATVPAEDIGLLLVDHPAVSYTQAVFNLFAELGAAVVICGETHMPSSMMMPIASNTIQSERYGAQIAASVPLKKQLWRQSVAAKIENQAVVLSASLKTGLEAFSGIDSGLREMARRVQSGDKGNLEAQAAQRYWPALFGKFFRRDREGDPPNNLLNYGYMVTRAAVARAICAAGLLPTLGIHHRNRYNAFCLADDLMEPYRPFVDWKVAEIARGDVAPRRLGREEKAQILGLFNHSVRIDGKSTPLLLAVHTTAASLARSFTEREAQLLFPEGLPQASQTPDESEGGETPDVPAIA